MVCTPHEPNFSTSTAYRNRWFISTILEAVNTLYVTPVVDEEVSRESQLARE